MIRFKLHTKSTIIQHSLLQFYSKRLYKMPKLNTPDQQSLKITHTNIGHHVFRKQKPPKLSLCHTIQIDQDYSQLLTAGATREAAIYRLGHLRKFI